MPWLTMLHHHTKFGYKEVKWSGRKHLNKAQMKQSDSNTVPTPPSFCKRGWRETGGRKRRIVEPIFSSTKREGKKKTRSKSVKTLSRASPEALDWFKLAWTCDWKTKQRGKKREQKLSQGSKSIRNHRRVCDAHTHTFISGKFWSPASSKWLKLASSVSSGGWCNDPFSTGSLRLSCNTYYIIQGCRSAPCVSGASVTGDVGLLAILEVQLQQLDYGVPPACCGYHFPHHYLHW